MTDIRALLVEMEMRYAVLGASLNRFLPMGFDPDAHYTPCEQTMYRLYEALGYTREEITDEAYELGKTVERLCRAAVGTEGSEGPCFRPCPVCRSEDVAFCPDEKDPDIGLVVCNECGIMLVDDDLGTRWNNLPRGEVVQ